jgi:uncharacterized membrane protein
VRRSIALQRLAPHSRLMSFMLLAVFRRHVPAGDWLLPLISGLTVLILAAVAVYVLSSVWRGQAGGAAGDGSATSTPDHAGLPAAEILDRRLASGEITIAEYEELVAVLDRRHAAGAGAAAANGNGTVTAVA